MQSLVDEFITEDNLGARAETAIEPDAVNKAKAIIENELFYDTADPKDESVGTLGPRTRKN